MQPVPRLVYGVDFSGARDAGRKVWVCAGVAEAAVTPANGATLGVNLAHRMREADQVFDLGGDGENGLAQLVVTLLNLVHELLERQAIRRMESGSLTAGQVEALGSAMQRQAEVIAQLCEQFGIDERDLGINLGPLGQVMGESD